MVQPCFFEGLTSAAATAFFFLNAHTLSNRRKTVSTSLSAVNPARTRHAYTHAEHLIRIFFVYFHGSPSIFIIPILEMISHSYIHLPSHQYLNGEKHFLRFIFL
jgi:hypothetical protein